MKKDNRKKEKKALDNNPQISYIEYMTQAQKKWVKNNSQLEQLCRVF